MSKHQEWKMIHLLYQYARRTGRSARRILTEEELTKADHEVSVVFEAEETSTLRESIIEAYKQDEEAVLSVSGDIDEEDNKQKGSHEEQSES